jgi:oxygen-dependent protoporphyrinogen oxidase
MPDQARPPAAAAGPTPDATPPTTADADVIVVGAGIAGLTAAWRLRHLRLIVLEAADHPGGRIRSEPRGDYWLNFGPHLFPGPDTVLGRLVTELGLQAKPVTGSTLAVFYEGKLLADDRTASYPARLPLSPRARVSLLHAGARIRRGVREYGRLTQPRPGDTAATLTRRLLAFEDDRTFADFLGPLQPGADSILRTAIRRVSAEPEELAAGAGIGQFAATFSGRGTSLHYNLPGGTALLPQAIAERLKVMLRLNCRVILIRQRDGLAEVRWTEQGRPRMSTCRQVIIATRPDDALAMIDGLSAEVRHALGSMRYGPYVVASLLTNENDPMPWDGIYAMVTPGAAFNMFFNTANLLRVQPEHRSRMQGGSLMVYGSSDLGRRLLDTSDDQVAAVFRTDLGRIFPELPALITEMHIQRWPQGIPFSAPGRHNLQQILEQPIGVVHLAGDYLGARGGMDTAAASGAEAAERALAAIRS